MLFSRFFHSFRTFSTFVPSSFSVTPSTFLLVPHSYLQYVIHEFIQINIKLSSTQTNFETNQEAHKTALFLSMSPPRSCPTNTLFSIFVGLFSFESASTPLAEDLLRYLPFGLIYIFRLATVDIINVIYAPTVSPQAFVMDVVTRCIFFYYFI